MPPADDPGVHSRPVTPLQLFEGRRSRRRREAPKAAEEQESRVQYTVCIWWVPAGGWAGLRKWAGLPGVAQPGSLYSQPLLPVGGMASWGCLAWPSQTSPC